MLDRTVDASADPRRSCARKKAYPTYGMARNVASRVSREREISPPLVPYACTEHCGRFHIGHAR